MVARSLRKTKLGLVLVLVRGLVRATEKGLAVRVGTITHFYHCFTSTWKFKVIEYVFCFVLEGLQV